MAYDYINDGEINSGAVTKGVKGNKKARILLLLKMLNEETDQEHQLSTKEIIDKMKEHGLSVNRKTVKDDVDLLIASGYDVVITKSSNNSFFMGDRIFELSDLKLLVDAVAAAKIISAKSTTALITRLQKLCSKYQAAELLWNKDINKNVKPYAKNINLTIDKLTRAIVNKKQIEFKYNEYDILKQLHPKHNGKTYIISPFFMKWNEDHYYLVGYEESTGNNKTFRIDRIDGPSLIVTKRPAARKRNKDMYIDYSQCAFNMMANEENKHKIKLKCRNSLITIMIDRFGTEVDIRPMDNNHFRLTTEVYVSTNFFSWLVRFGDDVELLGSPQVVKDYREHLAKILKKYE
ncbi:MAG: WYL domain-containing protein [Anaerovibrio sp.]|uniref:helix-turn-helix transcriptional regulator n=1 Tax=Anaerovibrio sp. TaxID=1872532 RepID=UPI0025F0137D|nr:WYL domain-containing protein [Anaerovibrio sp.]MCR5176338.1 WYL domain-containing protein [Anaerovibrio sp.]